MSRYERSIDEEAYLREASLRIRVTLLTVFVNIFRRTTNNHPGQLLLPLPSIARALREVLAKPFPSAEDDKDWYEVEEEYLERVPRCPLTNDAVGEIIFDGDPRKRLWLQTMVHAIYDQHHVGVFTGDDGLEAQISAVALAGEILNRIPDESGTIDLLRNMLGVAQQTLIEQRERKVGWKEIESLDHQGLREAGRPRGKRKGRIQFELELRCIRAVSALAATKKMSEGAAFKKVYKAAEDAGRMLFAARSKNTFSETTVSNWWEKARALTNKSPNDILQPRVAAFTLGDWPLLPPIQPLLESLQPDKLRLPLWSVVFADSAARSSKPDVTALVQRLWSQTSESR